ncbi:unnamed protein product [Clonostachys chloroleuca]|uniref:Uncharacterized protein n=1 Tax=Clonostachys chloroleuca TaxID=1926264 RepID=A0AA35M3T6_9HYPO|nr:unnamed protein product [Clonostachys chloroleuca]
MAAFKFPSFFARAPAADRRFPPSIYRPLNQTDIDHDHDDDDATRHHGAASGEPLDTVAGRGAASTTAPRDAAAMMLIKLGHDPSHRIPISSSTNDRILRRIDFALLPLMLTVYFLHALDKATLSYASIFGLIEDTKLEGDQFSWLGSIVYVAQLIFQLPVAWALVKLPVGKFTSLMALGWGITLTGMAGAKRFPHLLGARFLLGSFETSIGPSFVAITQMWWRRREQTLRIGSWYCMNGLSWVLGSLITYALASIHSSLKSYQIIFLFFGLVTVAFAFIMFFRMPDSPTEAKFLSDEDKVIAIERLRDNQMGVMSREWRYSQFYETLRDPKTWLWTAMIFCASVPSNGIGIFGPLIIKSFVSDPFQTTLFNIPVGFAHMIAVTGSAYLSMKWKLKGPVLVLLCIPPIIGLSILLSFGHTNENKGVLLSGFFCMCTFTGITPLIYSWSSQNTAGDTKKKSTSALIFIGSSAGNIIGPLLFTPGEHPAYTRGLRANIAFFSMVILLVIVTSVYIKALNKSHSRRRVALGKNAVVRDLSLETSESVDVFDHLHAGDEGGGDDESGSKAFSDATDLENEDFVYVF